MFLNQKYNCNLNFCIVNTLFLKKSGIRILFNNLHWEIMDKIFFLLNILYWTIWNFYYYNPRLFYLKLFNSQTRFHWLHEASTRGYMLELLSQSAVFKSASIAAVKRSSRIPQFPWLHFAKLKRQLVGPHASESLLRPSSRDLVASSSDYFTGFVCWGIWNVLCGSFFF